MITNTTILNTLETDPGKILLLCEIDWPTERLYTHTRTGEKWYLGRKWAGVGQFASIGTIDAGSKTGQLQLSLQVPEPTLVNEAVQDDAVGREVKLYVASTDADRRINAHQLIAYKFIAQVSIDYDVINTINLQCGSHRERSAGAKSYNRLTSNTWRARYPNDSYCDDIELLSKGPLSAYSGNQTIGVGRGGTRGHNGHYTVQR